MSFSKEQIDLLSAKLNASNVQYRKGGGGMDLAYVAGYHAIDEANRIFGFDGWNGELEDIKIMQNIETTNNYGKPVHLVVCMATYRVTVGNVVRVDVGYGNGQQKTFGDAFELASKEAATDAMKRALRTFGNQFGNALYDKEQKNVQKDYSVPSKMTEKEFNDAKKEFAEGCAFYDVDPKAFLEDQGVDMTDDLAVYSTVRKWLKSGQSFQDQLQIFKYKED